MLFIARGLKDSIYAPENMRFVRYSKPEEVRLERMGAAEEVCMQEMGYKLCLAQVKRCKANLQTRGRRMQLLC